MRSDALSCQNVAFCSSRGGFFVVFVVNSLAELFGTVLVIIIMCKCGKTFNWLWLFAGIVYLTTFKDNRL